MNWHIVMMKDPGVVSPQLRSFSPDIFLLDVSAVQDNTISSLFAPDVRIHDPQHPRSFMFDLIHCAFFGLGEFFSTHCEDCIFVSTLYP
jgi:hypothetical protein